MLSDSMSEFLSWWVSTVDLKHVKYIRDLLNSQGISVGREESALKSGATPDLIIFSNIPQITPFHQHIL